MKFELLLIYYKYANVILEILFKINVVINDTL